MEVRGTRKRFLPEGWYPGTAVECEREISSWRLDSRPVARSLACVAPHAGWAFSGNLACLAVSALDAAADTVIVFGGHLPGGVAPFVSPHAAFSTPYGELPANRRLVELARASFGAEDDLYADNTVEILLPFVKRAFARASVLWLRVPNDLKSLDIGVTLAREAGREGARIVAIGSTDLTHYGPAYGFTPKGSGDGAARWVAQENDASFVEAALAFDAEKTLRLGVSGRAACSSGAVLAAMGFASALGASETKCLGRSTSFDVHPSDSFVGYAALSFARPA